MLVRLATYPNGKRTRTSIMQWHRHSQNMAQKKKPRMQHTHSGQFIATSRAMNRLSAVRQQDKPAATAIN